MAAADDDGIVPGHKKTIQPPMNAGKTRIRIWYYRRLSAFIGGHFKAS
jgi:hypothetical protein